MRLYLDTNILVDMVMQEKDNINRNVYRMLSDYSNVLLTSTVCVHELIHLFQIGKIRPRKGYALTDVKDFDRWLEDNNIGIVPVTVKHLQRLASLTLYADHRDPNDRLIVAQAITDRVPLVSSDRKFTKYETAGLEFVYNQR